LLGSTINYKADIARFNLALAHKIITRYNGFVVWTEAQIIEKV